MSTRSLFRMKNRNKVYPHRDRVGSVSIYSAYRLAVVNLSSQVNYCIPSPRNKDDPQTDELYLNVPFSLDCRFMD